VQGCLGEGLSKKRSFGTSLWRFGSAIHGSADFWKAPPQGIPGQLKSAKISQLESFGLFSIKLFSHTL
jgi:hypothetical protein